MTNEHCILIGVFGLRVVDDAPLMPASPDIWPFERTVRIGHRHNSIEVPLFMWFTDGMFDDLADRADRAMRTMSARRAAEETHGLMLRASRGTIHDRGDALLFALSTRRGWHRQSERDFVCTFGMRTGTLTVPSPFDAIQLLRLIARVEVNVYLGDSDPAVLADLHALAQRELHQLIAAK